MLKVDETPIDAATTMDTNTDESNANTNTNAITNANTKTTYKMQAYRTDTELKDAIFGMNLIYFHFFHCLLWNLF